MGGLSANGFTKETVASLVDSLEQDLKDAFGPSINLAAGSVFAKLVGIMADRLGELWDGLGEVYFSQYPATAIGVPLDNAVALSGTTRLPATKGQGTLQLFFGTVGQTVPPNVQIAVDGASSSIFQTDNTSTLTLIAGTNAVQTITFSGTPASGTWTITFGSLTTGPLAYNCTASDVQTALNALTGLSGCFTVTGNFAAGFVVTFVSTQGLQPQDLLGVSSSLLTAGAVAITGAAAHTTPGVAQASTSVTCTVTGPVEAPAGSLTELVTPIAGITRTVNKRDIVAGRNVETDAELRIRRRSQLQISASATALAIRSKLLQVADVTSAIVVENDTDATDGSGRPPHSFECYVLGGLDADITAAIWANKPAGIKTTGSITSSTVDSQGITQTVKYSRPTQVQIYLNVTLTTNSSFPSDGHNLAKTALVNYVNGLGQGVSVIVAPGLISSLNAIPGITGVTVLIGTAPAPSLGNNIAIAATEIAVAQLANCTVTP